MMPQHAVVVEENKGWDEGTVENYLWVVDDSGEDYLYPASRFVGVDFPESVSSQLLAAVQPV
jgi:hypothetical protein